MAKIKLLPITDGKDKNRYCGPSIISALTDLTTGEAAQLIRKLRLVATSSIRGTRTSEIIDALKACNIKARIIAASFPNSYARDGSVEFFNGRPTLAGWLKMSKDIRTPGRVFLISAGWHWQLVSGDRYTCGRIRDIVSVKDKRVKRRARVRRVWELTSDNVTLPKEN